MEHRFLSRCNVAPLLGVALLSLAGFHLQLVEVRILSYLAWHHFTYLVLTVALLGFAAAGVLLSAIRVDARSTLAPALCAALFALSIPVVFRVLSSSADGAVDELRHQRDYLLAILRYGYLLVPAFLAGAALTLVLKVDQVPASHSYAASFLGAAGAAPLFLSTLKPLGAERSLFMITLEGALAALCFTVDLKGRARRAVLLVALPAIAGAAFLLLDARPAERFFHLRPAPSKTLAQMNLEVEKSAWDPLCRIDVAAVPGFDRFLFQDGDAPAALPKAHPREDASTAIYSIAYRLRKAPSVLVIGAGGGLDLWTALQHGAADVTGIEINSTTFGWMLGPYREFSGSIYDRRPAQGLGDCKVLFSEGRHAVRRSARTFDILQMTGTDTYTALHSGAYVLAESYLYTKEAFKDYFARLSPDGVLSLLRFGFQPPRESLRVCTTACAVLRDLGALRPSRHCAVVSYVRSVRINQRMRAVEFAATLFKKAPFDVTEISALRDLTRSYRDLTIAFLPDESRGDPVLQRYFAAADEGPAKENEFLAQYPCRVTPATDDSPFFFQFHRWSSVLDPVRHPDWFGQLGEDPVGLYVLSAALIDVLLGVLLFTLLPLSWLRRPREARLSSGRLLCFSLLVGAAYLAVEIVLLQRFTLFLGSPMRSLCIGLSSLLLFSGLGALLVNRIRSCARGVFGAIIGLLILQIVAVPALLRSTFHYGEAVRTVIAIAVTAPLAFFMGMPFTAELQLLRQRSPAWLPWAFGVNGAASVLASVGSVCLAIESGFASVLILATLAYVGAALTSQGMRSRKSP